MFCPQCGTENNDTAKFCKSCGCEIHAGEIAQASESKKAKNKKPEAPKPEENKSPAKKNSKIVIVLSIIVAVLILVAGGLLAWMFLNPGQSNTTDKHFSDPYDEVIYQHQVYNTYRNQVSTTIVGEGNGTKDNGSGLSYNEENEATVQHYKTLKEKYQYLRVSDIRPEKYTIIDVNDDGIDELIFSDLHSIASVYTKDKDGNLIDLGDSLKYIENMYYRSYSSQVFYSLTSDLSIVEAGPEGTFKMKLEDGKFKKEKYTRPNPYGADIADYSLYKDVGTTEVRLTVSGTVKLMDPYDRMLETGDDLYFSPTGQKALIICLDNQVDDVFVKSYSFNLKKVNVRTIEVGSQIYSAGSTNYEKFLDKVGQHVVVTFDASNIGASNDVIGLIFEMHLPEDSEIL